MSREDYEEFKILAKNRSQESAQRRLLSKENYNIAVQLATKAGIELIKKTEFHYQLKNNWLINVYPGNQRLYHDRNFPKPPFLKIKPDWNLLDIVEAAILASECNEQIQILAYQLWEFAGSPENNSIEFWLQAEKEILG